MTPNLLQQRLEIALQSLSSHGWCDPGLSFYVFLRHLLDGRSSYLKIDDHLVTIFNFAYSEHLLIFFMDGSFCIHGTHLKGLFSVNRYPFFCGLILVILQCLSESGKCLNAENLCKILPSYSIENIVKILSKKDLITNNDLKTLQLPVNQKHEDQLLVIFYSVFKNTYHNHGNKYMTVVNGDEIFFEAGIIHITDPKTNHLWSLEAGNQLSFRGRNYVYFIRLIFIKLLETIGSINWGGDPHVT